MKTIHNTQELEQIGVLRPARKTDLTYVVEAQEDTELYTMDNPTVPLYCKRGDYIATNPTTGEVWPIARHIFEMTYEFVK